MRKKKERNPFDWKTIQAGERAIEIARRRLERVETKPERVKRNREKSVLLQKKRRTLIKYIDLKTIRYRTGKTMECPLCHKIQPERSQWVIKRNEDYTKVLKDAVHLLMDGTYKWTNCVIIRVMINIAEHTSVECKSCYYKGLGTKSGVTPRKNRRPRT